MRLEGRRAFITGGGRGIGRAIALRFAAEGAHVAVAARTRAEVEAVAQEARRAGVRAMALVCDVGDSARVEEAVRRTEREWGGVDVMIANAGVLRHATLGETTNELWDEVVRVNLGGAFYCFRAAIDGMVERGWGRLIAVSSVSGKIGGANRSAYHAAKHGVLGLVRSVALEVAGRGVTANAICPGFVDTGLIVESRENFAEDPGEAEEATMRRLREGIPMGRFLAPEEIAAMALYLASDEARGITGQTYTISCGAIQV